MGMKEDKFKATALHLASVNGHQAIVKVLLNAFSGEKKENLIEYLMKKNDDKGSALHIASEYGYEKIVKLLLNVFSKDTNEKLIEYLKEKDDKESALHLASENGHENIVKLLSQKLINAANEKILCDLQQVTQIFKKRNTNENKKSLLWYLFDDNFCRAGKQKILSFIITDYDSKIHMIEDEPNMKKRKRIKIKNEKVVLSFKN